MPSLFGSPAPDVAGWQRHPGVCPVGREWRGGGEWRWGESKREATPVRRLPGLGRRQQRGIVRCWMPASGWSSKSFLWEAQLEKDWGNWPECSAGDGGSGQPGGRRAEGGRRRAGWSGIRTPNSCCGQQILLDPPKMLCFLWLFLCSVLSYFTMYIYLRSTLHRTLSFKID